VPCPIIYGAVVDSACLFWENTCGKRGACRVYDPIKFRQVFHGLTAAIMIAAFLVDMIVCFKAHSIRFHDEPDQINQNINSHNQDTTDEDKNKNNKTNSESVF